MSCCCSCSSLATHAAWQTSPSSLCLESTAASLFWGLCWPSTCLRVLAALRQAPGCIVQHLPLHLMCL